MFGLIRLPILMLLAFVAGVFFERDQRAETCVAEGGDMRAGLCRGLEP